MRSFCSSMLGRVFLILVGGILASATLTVYLAGRERQEVIRHVRTLYAAERAEQLVAMLDAIPTGARKQAIAAANLRDLFAEISQTGSQKGEVDAELVSALTQNLGQSHQINANIVRCASLPRIAGVLTYQPGDECRSLFINLKDGTPLHLVLLASQNRVVAPPRPTWLLYVIIFVGSLGLIAYVVARMTTRPLQQLALAATELGRNIERPPLMEQGPIEVRHAAAAFNTMQAQIRRYVQERTQMLAAITHDLQTPLTRIRLRLEKVQERELQDRLVEDLSAMQVMIRDGLDLARSINSEEPMLRTDFDSILDSVCADAAEAGQDVTLRGVVGIPVTVQPNAMRRCLTNLIDNAVKYGGYARVSVARDDKKVIVQIRDGGTGIPDEMLDAVFEPFFRLEGSRSRETGGTGIGLTIARNIAEKHGGKLTLSNHPAGGLVATLQLPEN